jgi:hypothetical protein
LVAGVDGTDEQRGLDGPLDTCQFSGLGRLCRYGDSLFVAEWLPCTIKQVDGVLGVTTPMVAAAAESEFEARVAPLIMTALSQAPKEIARLIAQYTRPVSCSRTIVSPKGPVVSGRHEPNCLAVDTTDPVAGPQLLIGYDQCLIRCFNLNAQTLTTIAGMRVIPGAGATARPHVLLGRVCGLVVAPNGVLYTSDGFGNVRRLSAAKWPVSGSGGPPPERTVTMLIGQTDTGVQFARLSVKCFQESRLEYPYGMALHAPVPLKAKAETGRDADADADADAERDVGRLYVGCQDGVQCTSSIWPPATANN